MDYVDVRWKQNDPDFPVRIVSELDDRRDELRKLEFFANGTVGFAFANHESNGTGLAECSIPPLDEINLSDEFEGVPISAEEFERLWRLHVPACRDPGHAM